MSDFFESFWTSGRYLQLFTLLIDNNSACIVALLATIFAHTFTPGKLFMLVDFTGFALLLGILNLWGLLKQLALYLNDCPELKLLQVFNYLDLQLRFLENLAKLLN